MIQATNLCKQFEQNVKEGKKTKKIEFMAVDHVSLEAKEGEIVGILGPNGAGKTTLLRMLGMLMTPTQGELILTDATGEKITLNFHYFYHSKSNPYCVAILELFSRVYYLSKQKFIQIFKCFSQLWISFLIYITLKLQCFPFLRLTFHVVRKFNKIP